jgi:hypothetical protein
LEEVVLTKQAQQVLRPIDIRGADVTLLRDGVIELVPLVAVQQHCWQGLVEVGSEAVYNFNGGVISPAQGPEWKQVSSRSQLALDRHPPSIWKTRSKK